MADSRTFITYGTALLLALMFAGQSTAQSPTPDPGVGLRSLVTLVSGEARFVRAANGPGNGFSCGPVSVTSHGPDIQILKFSFGKPRSGAPFGSWILRRSVAGRSGIRLICEGTFHSGNVNLTSRSLPALPAHHFLLIGRVTNADSSCFDPDLSKDIIITGACGGSEAVLTLLDRGRVIARGTFRNDTTPMLCDGVRPAGAVDRTLNSD